LLVINYLNARLEAEGESTFSEASHVWLRASVSGQDDDGLGWAVLEFRPVADGRRTAERRHADSARDRFVLAVDANKPLQPGDEPGEDLLADLAARARYDWQAAADDLFSDLGLRGPIP
jgi:hypothetical protein